MFYFRSFRLFLALAVSAVCGSVFIAGAADTGMNMPSIRVFLGDVEVFNQSLVPSRDNGTDFGPVNVANRVASTDLMVTNIGSSTVFVQGVSIQGPNAGEFLLTPIQPTALPPGGFMLFGIDFNPAGMGTRSALVSIANTDPAANPFEFAIQGEGILAPLITVRSGDSAPITNGSPASANLGTDFGPVNVRGESERRTFVFRNEGSAVLNITGLSFTGPWAADFSVADASPRLVAAGGSTGFDFVFDPSALGDRWATLWVTNNAENPFRFDVRGSGIGFPIISVLGNGQIIAPGGTAISPANGTDFGDVPLDGTFGFRIFTITNRGDDVLRVFAPTVTGTNAADFTVAQFPAATVAAGGLTQVGVLFSPGGKGLRTAELSIPNGAPTNSTYTFKIGGRGVRVPIPQRLLSPRLVAGRVQLRFGDMDGSPMSVAETLRLELQHSPTMKPGSWIPVPHSALLEGGLILIEDAPDPASTLRFYRVIER